MSQWHYYRGSPQAQSGSGQYEKITAWAKRKGAFPIRDASYSKGSRKKLVMAFPPDDISTRIELRKALANCPVSDFGADRVWFQRKLKQLEAETEGLCVMSPGRNTLEVSYDISAYTDNDEEMSCEGNAFITNATECATDHGEDKVTHITRDGEGENCANQLSSEANGTKTPSSNKDSKRGYLFPPLNKTIASIKPSRLVAKSGQSEVTISSFTKLIKEPLVRIPKRRQRRRPVELSASGGLPKVTYDYINRHLKMTQGSNTLRPSRKEWNPDRISSKKTKDIGDKMHCGNVNNFAHSGAECGHDIQWDKDTKEENASLGMHKGVKRVRFGNLECSNNEKYRKDFNRNILPILTKYTGLFKSKDGVFTLNGRKMVLEMMKEQDCRENKDFVGQLMDPDYDRIGEWLEKQQTTSSGIDRSDEVQENMVGNPSSTFLSALRDLGKGPEDCQ